MTLRVTDHAVLRYMERAMGLNVEIVRQHIEGICKGPAGVGAVSVRSEGVRFEIRNNTVLTVSPDRSNPSKTGRAMVQDQIKRRQREQQENELGVSGSLWPVDGRVRRDGAKSVTIPEPGAAGFSDAIAGPVDIGPGEVLS